MLLYLIPGASFEQLRTIKNKTLPTFKEACIAYNLLQDDVEWEKCSEEGASIQTVRCLRQLFATILLFCEPTNVESLWLKFRNDLCEDIAYRIYKNNSCVEYDTHLIDDVIENDAYLKFNNY